MAGPGQNSSAPLQVDTQSLVGRGSDPNIVGPAAVTALTDAFHRGFITADDVQERLSQRTKEKQALDLEQTQAARKNVGVTRQADEETKKAAILDAQLKPGDYGLMNKALALEGFSVRTNPEGVTDEDRAEIGKRYGSLLELKRRQTESASRVKDTDIKPVDVLTKDAAGNEIRGQVVRRLFQGNEISPKKFDDWAREDAVLRHTSLPQFYQLFSSQGQTVSQPAAAAAPVAAAPVATVAPAPAPAPLTPEQRAALVNQRGFSPTQAAMAGPEALVQPAVAVPAPAPVVIAPAALAPVAPAAPVVGTEGPGGMFVTGVTAATPIAPVKMSSEQQKGLAQAALTGEQIKDLAKSYETLSANADLIKGPFLGRLTSFTAPENWNKDYASFVRAQTAILANLAKGIYHETGVLSDNDIERYKKALPSIKDTAEVARAKLAGSQRDIYNSILTNIETMKGQGQAITPVIESMQQSAKDALAGASGAAPAASAGEKTAVIAGRTYVVKTDSSGRSRYFVRE